MISKLIVKGYRKFDYLELNDLGRINVFVGNNNVGKTTILESVYGWASGKNLSPFFNVGIQRNQWFSNMTAYHIAENIISAVNNRNRIPLTFQFSATDDEKNVTFVHSIKLGDIFKEFLRNIAMTSFYSDVKRNMRQNLGQNSSQIFPPVINNIPIVEWDIIDDKNEKSTHNLVWPNIFFNNTDPQKIASFQEISAYKNIDDNVNLYVYLKRHKLLETFTEEMQNIFPNIKMFDILQYPGNTSTPMSVQLLNGDYLPLHTFGEGFRRIYQIMCSLVFYHDNILCIDEIDATIHPSAQDKFCKYLIFYARKYNVQLFLTTHNLEFIDNMLSVWTNIDDYDDIRIITMKNVDNGVKIRNKTGAEALSVREDFKMELR